ncbi:hypothetical protein L211DRAFT_4752 [Terfezia boudieri ATCC MYA-4762]|uniref:Aminoglycoside phosphotransferase domain-containing protein n=1 Tax=Terfezia boudieri ATCC MYA-4762 TaxID=1051890 RepID=A0A3N4M2U5_9PEZI|nr:hypothetical protein L211DRAFT_4752 [Terfezia boudieri ATCC MYA-4762]
MLNTPDPDVTEAKINWVRDAIGTAVPSWVTEPDIRSIIKTVGTLDLLLEDPETGGRGQKREVERAANASISAASEEKQVYNEAQLSISFLAQGAFNKLYTVKLDSAANELPKGAIVTAQGAKSRTFVLRISLPVDPIYKTLSEVATTKYIHEQTNIPVPEIYAYEWSTSLGLESPPSDDGPRSRRCNEIGFEWILMEYMPGHQLRHVWEGLKWQWKEKLVDDLAGWCLDMFKLRAGKIGNLYRKEDFDGLGRGQGVEILGEGEYVVDRIVSMSFFWDKRLQMEGLSRGPFATAREWLQARLYAAKTNSMEQLLGADLDEDDLEDLETLNKLIETLEGNLNEFFPTVGAEDQDSYALTHDDITFQNLLLNPETGNVTAFLDWETVSFVPLFKATFFPHVLQGRNHPDPRPDPEGYMKDEETGRPNLLYFEHLKEWEQTKLRERFLKTMEGLTGGQEWLHVFRDVQQRKKRDFELAVQQCEAENIFAYWGVMDWLERCKGLDDEYKSLWDILHN